MSTLSLRIKNEIERRIQKEKSKPITKRSDCITLTMRNNDDVDIFFPVSYIGSKDFTVINDNGIIGHFTNVDSISDWIVKSYC